MLGTTVQNILYLGNLAPRICAVLLHKVMEVERSANNEDRSGRDLFQWTVPGGNEKKSR